MDSGSFHARVISNNRITIDEKTVELMGLKEKEILYVTIERPKQ